MTPVKQNAPSAASPVLDSSRRIYFTLCGTAIAAYASYSLVRTPVLPLFTRSMGLSDSAVGFVVAASTITGIFLKLPAGALSDRWGRRRLLAVGAVVFAISPFLYLPSHNATTLTLLRFAHGSATAIFGPVMAALISDLAPKDRRGSWLGGYAASQGAGSAVGQLLGGTLLSLGAFHYPFLASGICGILAWATFPRVAASSPRASEARERPGLRQSMNAVFRDPVILLISIASASQYAANGALTAFLPLYATDMAGLPPWRVGLLFGVESGCLLAFRPLVGKVSDRIGRAPIMVAGMVVSALSLTVLPTLRTFTSLLAVAVLYGAAFAATSATAMAWITDRTRATSYGTAHGAYGTIFDIGDAFGPMLTGVLVSALGYSFAFRTLAAPLILLAFFLGMRSRTPTPSAA